MMNARGNFEPKEPKEDVEVGEFPLYTVCPVWRFEGGVVRPPRRPDVRYRHRPAPGDEPRG